jgi:hypothetical protein
MGPKGNTYFTIFSHFAPLTVSEYTLNQTLVNRICFELSRILSLIFRFIQKANETNVIHICGQTCGKHSHSPDDNGH